MNTKEATTRYKKTNRANENARIKAFAPHTVWRDKDLKRFTPSSVQRDRQRSFWDACAPFCQSANGLFELALSQNLGLVESMHRMGGTDRKTILAGAFSRSQALRACCKRGL